MKYLCLVGAVLGLVACAFDSGPGPAPVFQTGQVAPPPTDYEALLGHPDRPGADKGSDALRKPADVLKFAGVGYGMQVLELTAGSGYYTELMSHAVGETGRIYMQNLPLLDSDLEEAIGARIADNRLPNVEQLRADFDDLPVSDRSIDLITWILGPHELWAAPSRQADYSVGEPDKAFLEIARTLKPGGRFIVLDNAASAGGKAVATAIAHRLDPAIVIASAEAAGLTLVERSDLLANPDDDQSVDGLDPAIQHRTDRFLLSFERSAL
ncbi:MAG: methyltransferase domain-containing protein [Pseudomonadota bacterium]